MPTLLVVHHSPTPGTRRLTDAAVAGAGDDAIGGVGVRVRAALDADARDVRAADGYVLVTPANFGYMSGALKHFFDTVFTDVGGALSDDGSADGAAGGTAGRPYGLLVHGRYDVTGAVRSVEPIVGALGWRRSAEVVGVLGEAGPAHDEAAYELGATIAALVSTT